MSQAEQDVRLRRPPGNTLSRSPHPYRRKSISLKRQDAPSSSTDVPSSDAARSSGSDNAEDQALEADDEKGRLLRLPAPPLRGRKGLRGTDDPSVELTPLISPAPTPTNEQGDFDFNSQGQDEKTALARKEKDELYTKYVKRRRAEIARRLTETLLLAAIGMLSSLDHTTSASTLILKFDPGLLKWRYEVICFVGILCGCYLLFPVRRSFALLASGAGPAAAVFRGFHVPSRFDPGILLYPVLLPLFIAFSLGDYNMTIVVNIILGLASMPRQVIPFSWTWAYNLHWLLSLVPMTAIGARNRQPANLKFESPVPIWSIEELSLLFTLHQTLVEVISILVTTSLDPSEMQLLSTGLINLLVAASTPQAQILKALLWVGGMCLFVFCESALRAEVNLARVPLWRFARNRPSNRGIMGRINRILRAILPESRSKFAVSASSDSEDETSAKLRPPRRKRRGRRDVLQDEDTDSTLQKTFSADEGGLNGFVKGAALLPKPIRSSTFSMYGRAATIAVKWKKIADSPNPYPRLNYLHAQALKILLAIYVYIATALTILLPVKYFISKRALLGDESVGWAIGYFIGDIPQVRMFVVNNNLDWWIKLPTNKAYFEALPDHGWLDVYRMHVIGAANSRLLLAAYCVLMVMIGIVVVLQLNTLVEVDTRRKVFHGVMVGMLLPTIPIDPTFFALALMIVLAVFLMLDLFRASQLPPISRPLTSFLAPYIDGRDYRGPVVVSHIFLLIGCAIPLWLSLSDYERNEHEASQGWEISYRNLSMVSGVICVGMGDAAASLIGRRYGRTKWYWGGGKSIEGSVAFAVAVTIGLTASWLWLRVGGWVEYRAEALPWAFLKAFVAGTGASVMESTLTAANDNVVVPIGLWLLVRGLRI